MKIQHYAPHATIVATDDIVQRYVDQGRPNEKGRHNATYLAMIESVDAGFGRLMTAIDDAGLRDRTIVVFFSDNGAVSWHGRNAPFRGEKKSFYEGGIRVPLLMRVPGVTEAGTVSDTPVNGIDFFPTLVELTGGDPAGRPGIRDGVSFVSALHSQDTLERAPMFWHHPALSRHYADIPPQGAVREGPWKLIDFYGDLKPDELYNLDEDPSEETNLAGQYPERVEAMRMLLEAHLDAVDAQRVEHLD